MAALARTESEHPTSSSGGDFGFVKRNQFSPPIDSAIFALQPNQVTEPLRDRFGFFLFQLVGKRAQPFEEVRTTIENNLRQERLVALFNRMKESYPITMDPRYFPETPDVPAPLP
jgi:parvulin-like peptidyl-prolyl isomerase